jgi:hypothetical protein
MPAGPPPTMQHRTFSEAPWRFCDVSGFTAGFSFRVKVSVQCSKQDSFAAIVNGR